MPMTAAQRALARGFLADPGTSSVQTVEMQNAVGGTFTLTFSSQTTSALAYNAGANVVQNALAALPAIGLGNVNVNGNAGVPGAQVYGVYFAGTLAAAAQSMLTINSGGLVGAGIVTDITQVTAGGVSAFSNTDLDNLYDFAAGYGTANLALAIAFGFDELLAFGAKFNDYVAGQSQEKKSQITTHLKERAAWWHQYANADRQVQSSHLEAVPPELRAVPVSSGVPATSLRYGPNGFPPYLRRGGW